MSLDREKMRDTILDGLAELMKDAGTDGWTPPSAFDIWDLVTKEIDSYIKAAVVDVVVNSGAVVTGQVPVGIPVATTGSAVAQVGATTSAGVLLPDATIVSGDATGDPLKGSGGLS